MANPESDNYCDTREKQLERLVAKIVEPMRRSAPEKFGNWTDAQIIEHWSDWYSRVENTILWNVESPRQADMLNQLYDLDMRLEELRVHLQEELEIVADRCIQILREHREPDSADCLEDTVAKLSAVLMSPRISQSFQDRVRPWLDECFGREIADDKRERNHRFLEEALELVQSCGCTRSEAIQLVDYVFARPVGEPNQEVGGVQITLAALCLANKFDMHKAGEKELARIWTKVEQIRAKQASKPKHSPLPQSGHSSVAVAMSHATQTARERRAVETERFMLGGIEHTTDKFGHPVPVVPPINSASLRETLNAEAANLMVEADNKRIEAEERLASIENAVRNLLNDVADRYKIYRVNQLTCPHMRALGELLFPDGDIIR